MNILITGSAGFIGKHLVNKLAKNKKNKIFALDKNKTFFKEKNVKFIKIDFSEKVNLLKLKNWFIWKISLKKRLIIMKNFYESNSNTHRKKK